MTAFSCELCSKQNFAKIICRSTAFVDYLKNIGILEMTRGKVSLFESLQKYFLIYLPPHKRRAEIKTCFDNLPPLSLSPAPPNNDLKSARVFHHNLKAAEFRLNLLVCFRRLRAAGVIAKIKQIEILIQQIKKDFSVARSALLEKICAANLPALLENILIYRYVDAEKFSAVAEISGYSLDYVIKLHRRGLSLLFAQDLFFPILQC